MENSKQMHAYNTNLWQLLNSIFQHLLEKCKYDNLQKYCDRNLQLINKEHIACNLREAKMGKITGESTIIFQ